MSEQMIGWVIGIVAIMVAIGAWLWPKLSKGQGVNVRNSERVEMDLSDEPDGQIGVTKSKDVNIKVGKGD